MLTGQGSSNDAEQALITTAIAYPSSGVRVASTLTATTGIEEAADGEIRMVNLSDVNIGTSGGGVPAGAFSDRGPGGDIPLASKAVLGITFKTMNDEFGMDPNDVMLSNALYDLHNRLPAIQEMLENAMKGTSGATLNQDLMKLLMAIGMEVTAGRTPMGVIRSFCDRFAVVYGANVAKEALPRLGEALDKHLPDYLKAHPHHYDHSYLDNALRQHFQGATVSDTYKSLFIISYNHITQQTEVFGAFRGILFPESGRDSSFKMLKAGETTVDQTPVYTDTQIADAILAATSIDGFIGQHQIQGSEHRYKDMGDFSLPVIGNLVDEMVMRAEHYLHSQMPQAKQPKKRRLWGKQEPEQQTLTPTVVPRLITIWNGYENYNHADPYHQAGFVTKFWQFPGGAQRAVASPVLAGLRARYNRFSMHYTGRPAVVDINANIIPAQNDADKDKYPAPDIRDGRIANLSKLTWFGAQRIFKGNADVLAEEVAIALRVMRDRGEISDERRQKIEAKVRARLQNPEALQALCDHLTLSERQVQDHIDRQTRMVGIADTRRKNTVPSNPTARAVLA